MSQTPRTPHARDNASLDPSQTADDAYGENDDLNGDENVDTGREQEAPPTGKRGRSPNWLPCELVCALLCRQHAVREKGCQSKLVERQNAAARVYSSIIHTLDDLGLCSWSDGGDGRKLPGNARESVTQRTAPHVESKIYSKGDGVKASLKLYAQTFSRLYVVNSKNGYSPSTGDNDGKITWGATEQACVGELSVPVGFDALRLAYRIVCASSPHLTTDQSLLKYVDAAFALDPAQRLDQEDVPTEKDLKAHQKRRMKEAGNDMAFGQVQNSAAIERHDKMEEELFGFKTYVNTPDRDARVIANTKSSDMVVFAFGRWGLVPGLAISWQSELQKLVQTIALELSNNTIISVPSEEYGLAPRGVQNSGCCLFSEYRHLLADTKFLTLPVHYIREPPNYPEQWGSLGGGHCRSGPKMHSYARLLLQLVRCVDEPWFCVASA